MTLILSCITREYVVQASDRRLTTLDGSLFEDRANKAIFFCGHSVFAYTGIARLSSKRTDTWLTDLLISAKALADGLPLIQRTAKAAVRGIPFPSSVTAENRRRAKRLAFVNVGFMLERQQSTVPRASAQYLRPILTVISNFFQPPDIWLPEAEQDFTYHHRRLPDDEPFALFASGQPLLPEETLNLHHAIRRCVKHATSAYPVARLLARQVRAVSERNPLVGPNVMCSLIPRAAVLTRVGQPPTSGMIPFHPEFATEFDLFRYPKGATPEKTYIYVPGSLDEQVYHGASYVCEGLAMQGPVFGPSHLVGPPVSSARIRKSGRSISDG